MSAVVLAGNQFVDMASQSIGIVWGPPSHSIVQRVRAVYTPTAPVNVTDDHFLLC
jgi:hypothetical protein